MLLQTGNGFGTRYVAYNLRHGNRICGKIASSSQENNQNKIELNKIIKDIHHKIYNNL